MLASTPEWCIIMIYPVSGYMREGMTRVIEGVNYHLFCKSQTA